MYQELVTEVLNKAKEFDSHLTRVHTLNDQLISRSEKLLHEVNGLLEKVQTQDPKKCAICFTRPVTMVFVSCGHTICKECSIRCKNGRARCFFCKTPVIDIIKIYL